MRIIFLAFLMFTTSVFLLQAEEKIEFLEEEMEREDRPSQRDRGFQWDRFFMGGGIGAGFGTYTYVNVSPMAGYFVTDRLALGLGGIYQYFNYRPYNFSTNIYGGSVFSRFYILENFFAHAEYEVINLEGFVIDNTGGIVERGRLNVDAFYLGGGYAQPVGRNSAFYFMALFDLLQSQYSVNRNPVIRVGFMVGL
ncbi:MAG: hypothetical protein EA412_07180 [Chitinophagaceae bacterium]|nr:MAG: hypothetical protein EA412_07180 [Chitinophagaceae bacterium]